MKIDLTLDVTERQIFTEKYTFVTIYQSDGKNIENERSGGALV